MSHQAGARAKKALTLVGPVLFVLGQKSSADFCWTIVMPLRDTAGISDVDDDEVCRLR